MRADLPSLLNHFASLALILFPALAMAFTDTRGSLNLSLEPGLDTNPQRLMGQGTRGDGFLALTLSGKGQLVVNENHLFQGDWDGGLKKYWRLSGEDVAVGQFHAQYDYRADAIYWGVEGSVKLRHSRSKSRDYSDLKADTYLDYGFTDRLFGRLSLGVSRFLFQPDHTYDFVAPQASATLRYLFNRQHTLALMVTGALPRYDSTARLDEYQFSGELRRDRQFILQLNYSFRGPVAVQAGYVYAYLTSNSFGESNQRHRLWAAASTRVVGRLIGLLQASYQYIGYRDGVWLSQSLLLLDDESQSSGAIKLIYPLHKNLDIEGKYAVYWIGLPDMYDENQAQSQSYVRQVALLAITLRW